MAVARKLSDAAQFVRTYGQHFPLAFRSIFDLRCTVERIRGRLRSGEYSATVIYAGRGQNRDYILKSLFAVYDVQESVRTLLPWYRRSSGPWESDANLLIVDIGWPYNDRVNRAGAFMELPDWISLGVQTQCDWETLSRTFRRDARRNDLRRVRRCGYRREVTSSRVEIGRFYDEMYRPYIAHIHGADAQFAPRWHVIRQGTRGALIKVVDGDRAIAAGVVYPANDVLVSLWMGLSGPLRDSPPEAAISTLYVFLFQYAIEQGYASVDFAGTRAFLEDGVLQFKRKWGAYAEDSFSPSSILVQACSDTPLTWRVLESLPVVARGPNGLEAVMATRDASQLEFRLQAYRQRYAMPGIGRCTVFVSDLDHRYAPSDDEAASWRMIGVGAGDLPSAFSAARIWAEPNAKQDE